ncbi:MAG: hypothetical protein WBB37_03765 [bacterium]
MLTIKCAKCKRKLFKYLKIGKGRILHCWKQRIKSDYTIHDGDVIKCKCGQVIGIDQTKWIKMHQKSFVYTGTKQNK